MVLQLHFNYLKSKIADMSDNISCLYLGIVYDWADSHVSISMEEGFHTGCDVSTTTDLEWGEKEEEKSRRGIYLMLQSFMSLNYELLSVVYMCSRFRGHVSSNLGFRALI